MSDRTRRALVLLAVALLLGVAYRGLGRLAPARLDAALGAGLLLAAVAALVRLGVVRLPPRAGQLAVPAALLVPALVWRDSPTLFALDLGAFLLVLALASPLARAPRLARAGVTDYLRAVGGSAAGAIAGALPLALADVSWHEIPDGGRLRVARRAGLGAAAALPVVVVFGTLFRAADPVYDHFVGRLLDVDMLALSRSAAISGLWAWALAGWLRAAFLREPAPAGGPLSPHGRFGLPEVGTALGAVALVFLSFIVVQIGYLFGGSEVVLSTAGMSFAEYARRGFFELVTVASLAVPLLLVADWAVDPADARAVRRCRLLSTVLVAMLYVVLASALVRMRLYTRFYGLTELRLYTTVFMLWLAMVLGWLVATVLWGRRNRFASGALAAAGGVLLVLNLLNPDALIARANLTRGAAAAAGRDVAYLGALSADAVPTLVAALPDLPAAQRCALASKLRTRWGRDAADGEHAWNLARSRAGRIVHRIEPTALCSDPQ